MFGERLLLSPVPVGTKWSSWVAFAALCPWVKVVDACMSIQSSSSSSSLRRLSSYLGWVWLSGVEVKEVVSFDFAVGGVPTVWCCDIVCCLVAMKSGSLRLEEGMKTSG